MSLLCPEEGCENMLLTISTSGFPSSGKNSKVYLRICPAMASAHSTSNAYRV